ncbi:MAG TPA: HEPN domain-containing protein [Rhodothermales bacterium]|nr:HEPN domain-containing protein [Rhodothermales bacterium]
MASPAVSRAYYAVFYAARAAVDAVGEAPATHAGVINRFGYHYVRTGLVDADTASVLGVAFERRHDADYDLDDPTSLDIARGLLADIEEFVEAVERLLRA